MKRHRKEAKHIYFFCVLWSTSVPSSHSLHTKCSEDVPTSAQGHRVFSLQLLNIWNQYLTFCSCTLFYLRCFICHCTFTWRWGEFLTEKRHHTNAKMFTFSKRSSSRVSCSFLFITDEVSEYSVKRLFVSSSMNRNSRPRPSSSASSLLEKPPSESKSPSSSVSSHLSSLSSSWPSPLSQVTQIQTITTGYDRIFALY